MAEQQERNVLIKEGERVDETGFGTLKVIQKPEEFCYGVDAVILADFASRYVRRSTETLFDLGTGTGIIPLILTYKTKIPHLMGVELQQASYERALRTSRFNGLEGRLRFFHGDVKDVETCWGKPWIGKIDMVVSNPPYVAGKEGIRSRNTAKRIARHETSANLSDFMKAAARLLREKGDFFLVHRPSRIVDICWEGRRLGLEPKEFCFVSPNAESSPNILLAHLVKGGGREVKMLPPLSIYDMDGNYSARLKEAYR